MSNKQESRRMKSAEKPALLPKRRFPEFQEAGEWQEKRLADICQQISNGKANAQDHENNGIYPVFDRSTVIKRSSHFMFDTEAVIIPGEGMRFTPKYFRGKFNLHQRAYALMAHQGDARFVYHSLDYLQNSLAKKAVKSTVLSLRLPIVENFVISCPEPTEQKKIADCLSSVDKLIRLETQKIDALKAHQKGLMQQLFPWVEETFPKRRFREFQGTEAWRKKALSELAKRCKQKNSQGKLNRVLTNSAEFGVIDQRDFFDKAIANQAKLANYFIVEEGDYVYNPRISTTAPVGPISKNSIACGLMSPLYTVFRFNNHRNDFYAFYFKTVGWHRYMRQTSSTGARHDRMAITNESLMAMPLPAPHLEEQQKIADCLSSLDKLIRLEAQKIAALKAHKKGLMQQLFAVTNEADR